MSRRWRYPRSRRGQFYPVVRTAAAPTPPTYLPAFLEPSGRTSRLAAARTRRGQFLAVPVRVPPPVACLRRPVRLAAVRRGRFYAVPLVGGVVPPAAVIVPEFSGTRPKLLATRRGRYWAVPQASPPAPPPWAPPPLRNRSRPAVPVRRGRYFPVPVLLPAAPAVWCPARVVSRRPAAPSYRRGRLWTAPRVYAPVAPPAYVPALTTAVRRGHRLHIRRGVFIEPVWLASVSSYTPLTDPVSSVRPNLATAIPRGNAGAAAVRPNPAEAAT